MISRHRSKASRCVQALPAVVLSAWILEACGPEAPPVNNTPEWPFAAGMVWSPDGAAALPPGAAMVSPEEFLRLSKIEGFQLVTASDRAAKAAAHIQEVADDEAYVQSMLGGDPRLSGWIPPLGQPGPFEKRADGSFLVTLPGAGARVVASNSRENVVQALAASLRATRDRTNLLQRYTSLIDRLPLDQRQDLPTAATIDQVDTSTLATQVRKLEQRFSESVPRQILPQGIAPGAGTGCSQPEDVPGKTIGDRIDWQLEPYETPIRDQGERGTCSAFAVTAGLETAVYRRLGVPIDLSEQELYAEARDNWLIDPLDYHDGIWAGTITDRMARENFRLDAEVRWPYNPSTKRETVPGLLEWRYSCDDYHHVCSNTNHQKGVVCSQSPPPFMGTYCAHHQPEPATVGGNIGNVRLKSSVSLWNPFEPDNSLASVRAHLDAGHPVVAGLYLDKNFTFAGLDLGEFRGWVEERSVPAEAAPHSVLIVGYVLEGDLPNSVRDFYSGFGGGYFVIKNSWGCNGDKGHWFASFDYFEDALYELQAITDFGTPITAPSVLLVNDRSRADLGHETVHLNATLNRSVVRYELYEGLEGSGDEASPAPVPILSQDISAPADGFVVPFSRTFTAADNGLRLFVANGYDVFGNRVVSNIVGVLVSIDSAAPQIVLSAVDTVVQVPGTLRLRATATDDIGVTRVRFFRGLNFIGQDTTAPYALDVGVGPSQLGTSYYTAIAQDAAGRTTMANVVQVTVLAPSTKPLIATFSATPQSLPPGGGTVKLRWATLGASSVGIAPSVGPVGSVGARDVMVTGNTTFTLTTSNVHGTSTRDLPVLVSTVVDSSTPTVALSVAPMTLVAPGTFTATATANDDVGVTSVELWLDGALFATDTSGPNYVFQVPFTAAGVGTHQLMAVAYDGAGHHSATPPSTVTVTAPTPRMYVSPSGDDTSNTTCAPATPCKTILHAATLAAGQLDVVLTNGIYDTVNQGASTLTLPAGTRVVAENVGQAVVKLVLSVGGGSIDGIVIDRTAPNAAATAQIRVTAGVETIVRFRPLRVASVPAPQQASPATPGVCGGDHGHHRLNSA